jgi:hypothetical protein
MRPRLEDTAHLEPEVVVEARGLVLVDDEPLGGRALRDGAKLERFYVALSVVITSITSLCRSSAF